MLAETRRPRIVFDAPTPLKNMIKSQRSFKPPPWGSDTWTWDWERIIEHALHTLGGEADTADLNDYVGQHPRAQTVVSWRQEVEQTLDDSGCSSSGPWTYGGSAFATT